MKALLIIPTYNEIKNIGRIIPAALGQAPELEILVMDDNSRRHRRGSGQDHGERAACPSDQPSGQDGARFRLRFRLQVCPANGYDYILKWTPISPTIQRHPRLLRRRVNMTW